MDRNASRPPPRPIKRLLIANRGEIAVRIISSARELSIETYTLYIPGDSSHALRAAHVIELASAAAFMNIDTLIDIVKKHGIDAVHPGYGFLSESPEFAKRMWDEAGAVVVGPGWGILEHTGDKLKARVLAEECNVPVSPALLTPTNNIEDIRRFAAEIGYPIIVKAVDGGGGRGIRLIRDEASLPSAVKRAVEESPSKQVFAEKAAVDGFRHVEVQIIGDGQGNVTHLWERECSIQRRYQKVVEIAPSMISDRKLIGRIIEDALKMARHISYFSLGTFEFLLNPSTRAYYFLEINPRLQVEHTITEALCSTDIVSAQLLLSQGFDLSTCGLPSPSTSTSALRDPETPPPSHSLQLRLTSENPTSGWTLSIGKITSFSFPSGNGIRVDTHLHPHHPTIVSTDFDSLLAKLIITASSWQACVRKAQRALEDTRIDGVATNLGMLRAIVGCEDFKEGRCDTQWLERNQEQLLAAAAQRFTTTQQSELQLATSSMAASSTAPVAQSTPLFRPGDSWTIQLTPTSPSQTSGDQKQEAQPSHHLKLTRIHKNDFPSSLTASILYTTPSTPQPTPYTLALSSTTTSAATSTSSHPRADPSNPLHISIPFPGKLVEVLVDEGDVVKEGDVICVVQQMKMELEVRAQRDGVVGWVSEVGEGEEVGEGWLVVVLEGDVKKGRDSKL
ncbi:hypothetical protein P154DRAFT_495180 [Amniculicola lignicola CBS 123094]|uniref:Uncharacterized protein n=1 Tax=Amniculicola lignicola CBS 123094 TaxID=1392246 RepID=A0A6A5W9Y1_9PLEO|nr:hypothetical protein P154DRAFT_495180 [Amniculicola lignicola CBS 123094]